VKGIDGTTRSLADFRGNVLLIVNVASRCGFTPQYAGLESLYREFKDRGFAVLGFPCNQFGKQEPGSNEEIAGLCKEQYDVTFPIFAKVDVNGPATHPLFKLLKMSRKGLLGTESIKWNFTKFLIAPDGAVLKRYGSADTPDAIERDVATLVEAAKS